MAKSYAVGLFSAITAATATAATRSSQTSFSDGVTPSSSNASEPSPKVQNNHPRTTASGFDHEALERGVKALKEIAASPNPKKIFEILKKQEETKQAEFRSKVAEFLQLKAQQETEKQRIIYDEEKKLAQHQAQTKSQMAKYEDELARKRMQAENEQHRVRNQELVKMQEDSAIRLEQARRATEEQIQAQRRQTEKKKAAGRKREYA